MKIGHYIQAGEGSMKIVFLTKNGLFVMPINVNRELMDENSSTGKFYKHKKELDRDYFSFERPNDGLDGFDDGDSFKSDDH
jgi:hypothetical protein